MKKVLYVIAIAALLFACKKTTVDEVTGDNVSAVSNFVPIEEALKIAEMQAPLNTAAINGLKSSRKVKSTFSVKPDAGNPSMYIVNYEDKGFVIISGDNRLSPILAYSDSSSFPTDRAVYPAGLVNWLSGVDEIVKKTRKDNFKQNDTRKKQWNKLKNKNVIVSHNLKSSLGVLDVNQCSFNGELQTYYYSKGPLTYTTWDQGDGYNELLPFANCTNVVPGRTNGRVWAGCVATAMAQIMKFWQYPTSYYWSAMVPVYGSAEVSRLIRDLGLPAKLNADYSSCDGTPINLSNVPATFAKFGYPTPTLCNYDYFTVKYQLQSGKPVIITGANKTGGWWIFFNTYDNGHAWVCDGYQECQYYQCQNDPNTPGEWIENYTGYDASLHMNWGFSGTYNGWYGAYNSFTPGNHNYNYQNKMIINIRKP